MGLFGKRKGAGTSTLREMPVAPGTGKLHAHAAAGKAAIRFDTVKGPSPEVSFVRMLGGSSAQAAALAERAWKEGTKFREFTVPGLEGAGPQGRVVKRIDLGERTRVEHVVGDDRDDVGLVAAEARLDVLVVRPCLALAVDERSRGAADVDGEPTHGEQRRDEADDGDDETRMSDDAAGETVEHGLHLNLVADGESIGRGAAAVQLCISRGAGS